ncbi:MAG: S8 family peptidase [Caulobacteraceae bacterium]|nr:S8 family peptidase [Caulobacteraceae bacterium]
MARPTRPLLRLDPPTPRARVTRPGFPSPRTIDRDLQIATPAGQRLQALSRVLSSGTPALQLRADPSGLAPERLLVFELTADVGGFMRAAARVPGLEFVGADELEPDGLDRNPALYLMIPDGRALTQMANLWRDYAAGRELPYGFAPWRDLFQQMKDLRAWGPQDRLTPEDAAVLAEQRADARGRVRLEIELVFRAVRGAEAEVSGLLAERGGTVISTSRIDGARYHALLADVPLAEVQAILARGYEGLIASEAVMHIRPQSAVHLTVVEPDDAQPPPVAGNPTGDPIVAVFDAVPLAGHPRLAGRLSVEDPFDLERRSVGPRIHGTAMASAVLHGDLQASSPPLDRRVHFVNVMYAPAPIDDVERFPDRLPADLFHAAVARMKTGPDATAPHVIVINASLGDSNKPFAGRMSGWARVIDYLSYAYGVLFVISAGNHGAELETIDVDVIAFENLSPAERAKVALRASGSAMAYRRVLAPAESMNALTVGALHGDAGGPTPQAALTFDVWADTGLCTVSSALGPGHAGAVKPDILAPGGRHHVRLSPRGQGHALTPLRNAGAFGGVLVAVPPEQRVARPDAVGKSIGTSVASALTTGLAARAHEALEAVYEDFLDIPAAYRAVLMKALLVHSARWTAARDLIVETLGPADNRLHVRQKDNVRRYLGFGAIDGDVVLDCTSDRATLWSVGRLGSDQAHTVSIPIPAAMAGRATPHEVCVTVAWMAPPRIGAPRYRGVQIKIVEPHDAAALLAVSADGLQPDYNQAHNGTVVHRRWEGARAAAFGENATFDVVVQRQVDDFADLTPYAVATTVKMAGVNDIYAQVRDRLAVRPRVPVVGT